MTYWKYFAAYNGPMAHYVGSGALPNDDDRTIIDRSKHSKHAQTHNRVVALSTADNHLLLAHHRYRSTLNIRVECNAQHAAAAHDIQHCLLSVCLSVCLSRCRQSLLIHWRNSAVKRRRQTTALRPRGRLEICGVLLLLLLQENVGQECQKVSELSRVAQCIQ